MDVELHWIFHQHFDALTSDLLQLINEIQHTFSEIVLTYWCFVIVNT